MRATLPVAAVICIAAAALVFAEMDKVADEAVPPPTTGKPASQPASKAAPKFHTSQVIVKQMPDIRKFLHAKVETNVQKMMEDMAVFMPLMEQSEDFFRVGPGMFIYEGKVAPGKKFTLTMGVPVSDDSEAPKGYKISELKGGKFASVYYTGAPENIGKGWGALMQKVFAAGLQPAGEGREFYHYWEGDKSPNNVIEMQIRVK